MLETMIAGGLRVAAVLLLMMGIVVALRGASAATRHAVWRAGFAMALVLPLLALTFPWKLPVLPADADRVEAVMRSGQGDRGASEATSSTTTSSWLADEPAPAETAPYTGERVQPEVAALLPGAADGGVDWTKVLLGVWLAGALLLAARLVVGHVAVRRIARTGRRLTMAEWTSPLYEAADIIDVAVDVELVQSDRVTMPFTAGVRRPVIVMPESAGSWDLERRRAVLMHELAHVRRRDLIPHHVARWVCALHWFNPLAWMGARRMRAESERAADDLVLAAGTRASEYADHLLQIVSTAGRSMMPAPALPLAQRREFEGRMLAILEPGVRRGPGRLQSVVVSGMVLLLTLPLAALERETPGGAEIATPSSGAEHDTWGEWAAEGSASLEAEDVARTPAPTLGEDGEPLPAPAPFMDEARKPHGLDKVVEHALAFALPTAAQAAGEVMQDVLPALLLAVNDVDSEVRNSVVTALGGMQDPRAVQALMRVLRDDAVAEVRAAAAWALGEIEDAAAVPALSQSVRNDGSAEVRKNAAWALGQIESPAAVEALAAALRDADVEVRRTSLWALGQIESPAAVPALIAALESDDVGMRRTAVWALGNIEDARAVPVLLPLIGDADAEVREATVHALAQIEDPRAAPGMVRALGDANAEVRHVAAHALADMNLSSAPPALINALRDANADVRSAAAHSLGEIGDVAAVASLRAALDDDNADVRETALHAMLEMDGLSTEALLQLLQHDDPTVRRHAAEHLGDN